MAGIADYFYHLNTLFRHSNAYCMSIIQWKMILGGDQKVLYRKLSVFESNLWSKSLLFRCFHYLDVRYSDPHCISRIHCFSYLSGSCQCVSNGQGEGDGSPQPREEQHVLEIHGDLVLPSQVQEEGQGVDVQGSTKNDGNICSENKSWRNAI